MCVCGNGHASNSVLQQTIPSSALCRDLHDKANDSHRASNFSLSSSSSLPSCRACDINHA